MVQAPPLGAPLGVPVQVPVSALHVVALTHWLESVQLVRQALAPQTKGLHDLDGPALQLPFPSQVDIPISCDPVQLACAQTVPAGYGRHAPLPSQNPSLPHDDAPVSAH